MSVGLVNIEGFGSIIVPGFNDNERMRYAQNLINNGGVFIPPAGKCKLSVLTWDPIPEDVPAIAVGKLSNYLCFTLEALKDIYSKNKGQEFLFEYEKDLVYLLGVFPGDNSQLIRKIQSKLNPLQDIYDICNDREALMRKANEWDVVLADHITTEQLCQILLKSLMNLS